MEINLEVLPQHGEDNRMDAGLASPMGGKHQRSRSLSAKWANDKALALEYLHRQHEVITWIEHVLQRKLPTTDLFEALKSGIVLRELVEALFPDASNCMSPISRNYTKRMAPWKERENISVFLRQCKALGMNNLSLFCTDDLYEGNDMLQVLFCAQHFKLFAEDRSNEVFHPVAKNQPAVFSNQDLEMALSKIEKSGMDSTALQGLMSGNSSSSCPEQRVNKVKNAEAIKSAESAKASACSPISEEAEEENEEEPAETDNSVEQQLESELYNEEGYNQMPEEKPDVATTEVKAESSPEQESGDDVEDIKEAAECEDASDIKTSSEDCELEDKATMVVIVHVLADMAAAIEEAEIAAYQKELAAAQMKPRQAECHVMETEIPNTEPCVDVELEIKTGVMDASKSDTMLLEIVDHKATQMPSDVNLHHSTKTSTEPAKSVKTKELSEEELEAEAMAKCTCGKGCSIM